MTLPKPISKTASWMGTCLIICMLFLIAANHGTAQTTTTSDTANHSITQQTHTQQTLNQRLSDDILPVLDEYCLTCHDASLARGGYNFETLNRYEDVQANLATVIAIGKAMTQHTMPPQNKPQPTTQQRQAVAQWVHDAVMFRPPGTPIDPGYVTLRRLNRVMYANTLRDLLSISQNQADQIAQTLPADDSGYGFDHIGDVLSVSPLLIEQYLTAAEQALDLALLASQDLDFQIQNRKGNLLKITGNGKAMGNGRAGLWSNNAVASMTFHAPVSGMYEIKIIGTQNPAGDEPARGALRLNGKRLATYDFPATKSDRTTQTHAIHLPQGEHEISVRLINDQVVELPVKRDRNLHIHQLGISGPHEIQPDDLPRSHRNIFDGISWQKRSNKAVAAQIIQTFATQAFRRPVSLAEVAPYVRLYQQARQNQADQQRVNFTQTDNRLTPTKRQQNQPNSWVTDHAPHIDAIKLAFSAILVSPEFLFLIERHPAPNDPTYIYELNDHEIATRLSYFLWSSMPDQGLRTLAQQGLLNNPDVLNTQIKRMLADPKSHTFIQQFTGQWLQLRNLNQLNPDQERFGVIDQTLKNDMRREVELIFEDTLQHNRSIFNLIDRSDTFINSRLAELYDLPTPAGATEQTFVQTPLDPNDQAARGGILTTAAVLTVTSHPTRTSPVKRGLFMLENVLGAAPPPPPADVPQIAETQEAAEGASLRERLEAHLIRPDCRACHLLMDPIGYSLERFDAVGRFRTHDEGHAIDDTGSLPDGSQFTGAMGLKQLVLDKPDWYAQTLTEKLMVYALGRGLEPQDEALKLQIAEKTLEQGGQLQTLIQLIVQSPAFRQSKSRAPGSSLAHDAR